VSRSWRGWVPRAEAGEGEDKNGHGHRRCACGVGGRQHQEQCGQATGLRAGLCHPTLERGLWQLTGQDAGGTGGCGRHGAGSTMVPAVVVWFA
jgi:hypothetical protein